MKFLTNRVPVLALACVLSILSTGCATSGAPGQPTATPQAVMEESAWAFFIDTGDEGDDIWAAGCHYKCSDPECSGPTEFWGGDSCSGDSVQEWVNSAPHAAESDIARHDCDQACKQKGAAGGTCVRVEKACDGIYPSSRCECDGG